MAEPTETVLTLFCSPLDLTFDSQRIFFHLTASSLTLRRLAPEGCLQTCTSPSFRSCWPSISS